MLLDASVCFKAFDHVIRAIAQVLQDANGNTFDLDIEGLATRADGGFWVASEGAGSVDEDDNPVISLNLLLSVARPS